MSIRVVSSPTSVSGDLPWLGILDAGEAEEINAFGTADRRWHDALAHIYTRAARMPSRFCSSCFLGQQHLERLVHFLSGWLLELFDHLVAHRDGDG